MGLLGPPEPKGEGDLGPLRRKAKADRQVPPPQRGTLKRRHDPFGIIIEIKTGNPTQQVLEEALVQAEQYSSALRVKGGWTKPFKSIVLKQSGNKLQFSLGDETLRNDELIKRLESIEIPRP